jgi:hypothetical protein
MELISLMLVIFLGVQVGAEDALNEDSLESY